MPRWVSPVLRRIHRLVSQRDVRFTLKAQRELALLGIGLDVEDACDILARLTAADADGRLVSELTGEWMYIFRSGVAGAVVYIKLVLRENCLVVSFHESVDTDENEDD